MSKVGDKLAKEMFEKLGIDPKTGKLLTSPNSSYKSPRAPFRIKDLEKTKRQSPKGKAYQHSALYRNAVVLRLIVKKFTNGLNPKKYHRLISQLDSAARSVTANIREGYVRPKSREYSTFLGFSHGSLEEVRGDIIDVKDDGLLRSVPGSSLKSINISLKPPPNVSPKDHLRELKRIIRDSVRNSDLTYEIFIELINKTDYLLKRAVSGIDEKIIKDEKQKLNDQISSHWRKHW